MFAIHGKPRLIRADNGREFIADALLDWLGEQQVRGVFVAKASPQQNGYIERFNGTMERELFGHEVYHSVPEVQYVTDEWTEIYNQRRVHRGLNGQTPAAFAAYCEAHPLPDEAGCDLGGDDGESSERGRRECLPPPRVDQSASSIAPLNPRKILTRAGPVRGGRTGKFGVVGIDLSKVSSEIADVSGGFPEAPGMMSNWAIKDQEVLIRDYVPPEAIFAP